MDKPWLSNMDATCLLCHTHLETHQHLFFGCMYSQLYLLEIRRQMRFPWPYRDWMVGINWETRRWRGKHIVNASYRCLLASLTYHVWQERNHRRFQGIKQMAA
ncbi:UNVERIFIED_CONTAM: hypothetical protein Sradi_4529500, partial [Sesamum radiatum]